MEYEWHPAKAEANLAKHGVAFETVRGFDWGKAVTEEDRRWAYGEARFIAVAPIGDRLHVLIFTLRGSRLRVIGLRKANAREVIRHGRSQTG